MPVYLLYKATSRTYDNILFYSIYVFSYPSPQKTFNHLQKRFIYITHLSGGISTQLE